MAIDIKGLDEIQAKFNKFNFMGKNVKYRFLEMVGVEALQLLKMNTPVDTGELREGWMLQQSENEVVVMNDQQDLLEFIALGTIRHIPNPFIQRINHQIDMVFNSKISILIIYFTLIKYCLNCMICMKVFKY